MRRSDIPSNKFSQIAQLLPLMLGLLFAIGLSVSIPGPYAFAQVDAFEFDNEQQQRRFRKFSDELRCPMCQNTSLSGSSGGTAEDLRRELYRMIIDGWSDQEIEQFMYDRYGDFIFYRPRFRADTLILWLGPLGFLLLAAGAAMLVVRRSQKQDNGVDPEKLDAEQQRKLDALLNDQ